MKKILIILVIMLLSLPAMSKTLTGGIVYTVESARKAAFEGIEYKISMEPFKKYMKDPGFISPAKKDGGRPKVSRRGRRVVWVSSGGYGVIYNNNKNYAYLYDQNGQLVYIDIRKKDTYPYVVKKYDVSGNLVTVSLIVRAQETFVYDLEGNLLGYWVGNIKYDKHGKVSGYRTY